MNINETPSNLRHWSVDEVAECLDGVTPSTYKELWDALIESEQAGTMKPSGGDGSDGTFEEPVITEGEYGSDLVAAWPKLSVSARENIWQCAIQREHRHD